jgi:hypothetical protein
MISLCVIQNDKTHYEITTTDVREKRPVHIIIPENVEDGCYTISVGDSVYASSPGFLPVTEKMEGY